MGRKVWETPMWKTIIHTPVRGRDGESVTWQDSLHKGQAANWVELAEKPRKWVAFCPWSHTFCGRKRERHRQRSFGTTVKSERVGVLVPRQLPKVTAPQIHGSVPKAKWGRTPGKVSWCMDLHVLSPAWAVQPNAVHNGH